MPGRLSRGPWTWHGRFLDDRHGNTALGILTHRVLRVSREKEFGFVADSVDQELKTLPRVRQERVSGIQIATVKGPDGVSRSTHDLPALGQSAVTKSRACLKSLNDRLGNRLKLSTRCRFGQISNSFRLRRIHYMAQ